MKLKKSLISLLSLVILSGCNYQLVDLTYNYNKVHIYNANRCFEIKKWTDYEGEQLQVQLNDDSMILLSSMDCMLIKGVCPICKE